MIRTDNDIIFISGPMSGIEDFNHPAFFEAEKMLKEDGFTVLNPARLPLGLTDEAYMDIGLAMVRASDFVFSLRGYEQSDGSLAERALAIRLGKMIFNQTERGFMINRNK